MFEKSQEYLRLAIAAAALLIGASVAYHYIIYIPEQDRAETAEVAAKQLKLAHETEAKQEASKKTALERRANYRICLSTAQSIYSARWDASCKVRSEIADKSRADCLSRGISEEYCRTSYPPFPATDCTLANALSDDYDASLREDKKRCLDEAQSGVLESL